MKISSVDCITELLAYTYHLADHLTTETMAYDQVAENYDRLIRRSKSKAKAAGIPKKKFDGALFAVFAWIDETILETGWTEKNQWIRNSLQKRFFNTTNAGDEFFTRLNKLKPEDTDTLEAFEYCLASGFKGSLYGAHDRDKLTGIIMETRRKLDRQEGDRPPEILFPDAGDIRAAKRLKRKRWRGLSNLSSLFVLLPLLLFAVLYFLFNERLTQMIRDLGPLLR